MNFPRVLIVGQYFNLKSGGGITMTNLFKGWDNEKIAVAAEDIINADFSVCSKNYQLGILESKRRFPFNLKIRKNQNLSGPVNSQVEDCSNKNLPVKESRFVKIYDRVINYSGLVHYRNKLIINDNFITWIKEFQPDFIYTQLSSYHLILLVTKLYEELHVPVAIHIMDDWPVTITSRQKSIFKLYWFHLIDKELRQLFQKAKVLMSISESMSEAYFTRYRLKFIPFHNPITLKDWLPYSKKDWSTNDSFKIIYTGRIGTANDKSILYISTIISELNQPEIKIKLDIYATDTHKADTYLTKTFRGIEIKEAVPHKSMPCLLSSYDLLLLPLDFDEEGINFARYSMPTKTSEYMVSGTPILVFADKQTALAKYASLDGWAFVVSEYNSNELITALNELISNKALRMSLADKAKKIAIQNEDAIIVRERFRRCFNNE